MTTMNPSPSAVLHQERTGAGEPLLLLHGIGSTRQDFAQLTPRLAEHFDVIAVDLPGHGHSPALGGRPTVAALADAVEAHLDALGLGPVHVLGNSLGARIGLELARRGRALSLVATSPSGLGLPAERAFQGTMLAGTRLLHVGLRPWTGTLARSRPARAALLTAFRAQPWASTEPEVLGLRDGFGSSEDFWSLLRWAILADVPTGLSEIGCPVILAEGTGDVLAAGQSARYLALVPGARYRALPGAGHAPQSDTPSAIVSMVREAAGLAGGASGSAPVAATAAA